MQTLKTLSKDCDFQAVDANTHRDQYIRDSFIAGLQSSSIRQRLLEDNRTALDDIYIQARSLEHAQQNIQAFQSGNIQMNANAITLCCADNNKAGNKSSSNTNNSNDDTHCWNCGNQTVMQGLSVRPKKLVVMFVVRRVTLESFVDLSALQMQFQHQYLYRLYRDCMAEFQSLSKKHQSMSLSKSYS